MASKVVDDGSLEELYNQLLSDLHTESDESTDPSPLTPHSSIAHQLNGSSKLPSKDPFVQLYPSFDTLPPQSPTAADISSRPVISVTSTRPSYSGRASITSPRPLPRPPSDLGMNDPYPSYHTQLAPPPPSLTPSTPPTPAYSLDPRILVEPADQGTVRASSFQRSISAHAIPSPGSFNRRLMPDGSSDVYSSLSRSSSASVARNPVLDNPVTASVQSPGLLFDGPYGAASTLSPGIPELPTPSEPSPSYRASWAPPPKNATSLTRQVSRPPKGAYTPAPPGVNPALYSPQVYSPRALDPEIRSSADAYATVQQAFEQQQQQLASAPMSPISPSSNSTGNSKAFSGKSADGGDNSAESRSSVELPTLAPARDQSTDRIVSGMYSLSGSSDGLTQTGGAIGLERKMSVASSSAQSSGVTSTYRTSSLSAFTDAPLAPSTAHNLLESYAQSPLGPYSPKSGAFKGRLELHDESDEDFDEDEDDEERFVNFALLSHIAVRLRDKVPRGTHVKGSIPYPRAFTGKDIVSTIQAAIQRELISNTGAPSSDRTVALQVARSLQSQLFFYEVEWGGRQLTDGVEDVYMFLDDAEGPSTSGGGDGGQRVEMEELPTAVVTVLTKCYAPSCGEGGKCYTYGCPRGDGAASLVRHVSTLSAVPSSTESRSSSDIPAELAATLPESEVKRQSIIRQVIVKEEQYIQDLELIETLFIRPLRRADPPIFSRDELEEFITDVFYNLSDLRQCNRRLLEMMHVRQREQAPVVLFIGDVFLTGATDFRSVYPDYVGHLPVAEKRIKDSIEANPAFRLFLEQRARRPESRRMDLKHFITRPSEHLQKYPILLDAILQETAKGNPDADYLAEAIQAIRNLSNVAHLLTFQSAMCRGPTAKLDWSDLVSREVFTSFSKTEAKRQAIIFELIKGEMEYVKDLELIETIFVRPLLDSNIIQRDRLSTFIEDVFHNFADIHKHHRLLLDRFHAIQRDEHPHIRSITAPVYDAALNWREAYMEYVPHFPIAAYKIDEELANNPAFKSFVEQSSRHPDARRLDIKFFVNRPIPRILRYDLLLSNILEHTPGNHEDREAIPAVLDVLKSLAKGTNAGISSAEQKVQLWKYNSSLQWRPGEFVDMDLLDESRSLIHSGKLLRSSEGNLEWNGWTELFVLLFDNYLLMTKPKEKDGLKYNIYRRPMPLELVSLLGFDDPPQQRSTSLLRGRGLRSGESAANGGGDPSSGGFIYPCSIHNVGRVGGHHHLFAESAQIRADWKEKLKEAIGLRAIVNDANKVFEPETLTASTFKVPSFNALPSWDGSGPEFTGKVTCSVPFSTPDGRGLVAIGCAEGVWIGLRHDANSMRRVLHLKMVTQCAMLEDFGIFLVLADKSLFAYHIEALVPSNPQSQNSSRTPQKLNGTRDVQFFTVGNLNGRTLVIYMKKKGTDSVFRALEPVIGKIAEKAKAPGAFGRFNFGSQKSDWFRVYRDFFLPAESYDLIFLKAKVAVLCTRGFEVMDLVDLKSATIPQNSDPKHAAIAKRCESCRPMGMFRSAENEFLLCYDEFGLYVDRHGDPSKTRSISMIEWEGTAERVAFHAPYILIFDQRFIEIRHIDKCNLVQIIRGTDIRCTWDGRGTLANSIATPGPDGWNEHGMTQESRIHVVKQADAEGFGNERVVIQEVLQLVPTLPLYIPPPLTSPTTQTNYFTQGRMSPPPQWR